MSDALQILSLGAGVQSSTLALMAEHGEFDVKPDAAIFADTQDESAQVYEWLGWLEKQLSFPVHRVTKGKLSVEAQTLRTSKKTGQHYLRPCLPVFFRGGDGISGRHCTMDYKIAPIRKKLNELRQGRNVIQWIGISLDETQRIKPSRDKWCENVWPLVESRMRRGDCFEWMKKHNYPTPPRSSCVYCPFHTDNEWRRLKEEEPEEFVKAVEFEKELQRSYEHVERIDGVPYLHRSGVPLSEVDLRNDMERGQLGLWDNPWGNECEGMCGV